VGGQAEGPTTGPKAVGRQHDREDWASGRRLAQPTAVGLT
jgi:hypothetical protein